MLVDIVLVGAALLMGAGAYFLKRHAAVLILLMMGGGLVAGMVSQTVSTWLQARGLQLTVPLEPLAGASITLIPPLLGWLAGPKGKGKIRRLLGAVVLGLVAIVMLTPFMGGIFHESLMASARLDDLALQYQGAILGGALVYTIVELYLAKAAKKKEDKTKS